jgi:release factor glutamine methyltransferase
MHRVENLSLVAMDLLDAVASAQRFEGFDVLVANLPYIPSDDLHSLQPEVRIGDPLSALDGGCNGTAVIRRLLTTAAKALLPEGLLALEIGENQAGPVGEILSRDQCSWKSVSVKRDLAGVERVICAVKAGEGNS